jgi:NADH-quinone oxidoreductase subunit G
MGGSGRGDRLEIGTCVQNSINSELSGNIIDICPVGALTNKPFRFAARAWELMAKPSLAIHDGVGSCLFHHVRRGQILRSVPRENEATNETWLSDRDRYSHIGLYSDDRITTPQVKESGKWKPVSWDEAIEAVAGILKDTVDNSGPEQLGMLMSPSASSEEYFLAQRLLRGLGSGNIDHRLREQDFSDDAARPATPQFEKTTAEIENSGAVLLLGCNPREEAPLIGHRIRKAWRAGAKISSINPLDWEFTFDTSLDSIVAPQNMVNELAALAVSVEKASGSAAPASIRGVLDKAGTNEKHDELASRLKETDNSMVILGQFSMSHPDAAWLRALAAYIADASGSALNILTHGGNSTGAWQAGAVPHRGPGGSESAGGMDVVQMLAEPRQCYLLWGVEPDHDIDNPARAMNALREADKVISIASHANDGLREISDVILPLAALAESEGSLVTYDRQRMSFRAAGKAPGEARPGWKILRRLGSKLALEGFGQLDVESVLADLLAEAGSATAAPAATALAEPVSEGSLYRIGELPMYSTDALCRRSTPLQETVQARNAFLGLNPQDAEELGLSDGSAARVSQGEYEAAFEVTVSAQVPAGGAWLRSANEAARELGSGIAPIIVEVA